MDNLAFAATDLLVVIGAAAGIARIWPWRAKGPARFVRLGLALVAIAALIGAVRFATGQVDALAGAHATTSEFAATAGLLLIALGPALYAWPRKVDPTLSRYLRIGIPVLVAVLFLFPVGGRVLLFVPTLALLIGFGTAGGLLLQRRWTAGIGWLLVWVVAVIAGQLVGSSRETTTFGIADWHVYHTLMAIWAWGAGEAMRRTLSGHAHI